MKKIFLVAIIALFITPQAVDAYTSTSQKAYRVNDTTALYYIDFVFGHNDHPIEIPVLAKRNQKHGEGTKTLGYSLLKNGLKAKNIGTTRAVVISNGTKISNARYQVPQGEAKKFTLAVILNTKTDLDKADYSILVTDLPFMLGNQELRLNPSELQYYRTPEIELNESNQTQNILETIKVELKSIEYTAI